MSDKWARLEDVAGCFDQPAYLADERGTVIFANAAAQRRWPELPPWVRHQALGVADDTTPTGVRSVCCRAGGMSVHLVVAPPDANVSGAFDWKKLGLSEPLAEIASLAAMGLSDKEIADRVGRPLPTVRTYVSRILRRVGVRRRTELVLLAIAPPPETP
jgi:DNA-binding CsgD family transcriptional regulator